jgi:prepilin-type N-terminal cleavage/methylation domain-containing protein
MRERGGVMECGSMGVETVYPLLPYPTLKPRSGFTLLEIMVSMVIFSIALTLAWQTFSTATRAWTSGRKAMDQMHHGDFVLTQLSAALRSMAFFEKSKEHYGFRMENNSTGYGEHSISWVTASQAFIPRGEMFEHGLHRIEIGAGTDDDGTEGLVVTAWQHLADEEDVEKKSWFITETIKGLSCMVYDTDIDEERWREEWEYSNAIPGLIEITLYAEPVEKYDDPLEFRQLIEIPLGPPVTNDVSEAR